jgi:butyryl-CoA dehydrogenase
MLLTQDQEMIRDAVRDFAQSELWPHAARWDREHHFPKEAHQGLAALGAYGICVPEELGGAHLDYLTLALVLEEIAAGDGGTSTAISVTNCPVNAILMRYGNAQQKRDWLTPLARGEMLGAFCLTEPHVGSDASALRTTAVKEGDEYVINGVKQFITSGKNGHVAIVIAVTDKGAGKKGMSAFLVPTSNPGYVVARLEDKLGQHSSDTAQINFDHCRIPAENLIGQPRARATRSRWALWRAGASASPRKAWAWRAARSTRRWRIPKSAKASAPPSSTTRPWAFAWPTAPRRSRPRASSSGTPPPARRGPPCLKEAAMAKLFASEMAERVCSAAIQTLGGYGVVSDFPVERIYRDVRVCQIYEGTSDVQKIIIQRALA